MADNHTINRVQRNLDALCDTLGALCTQFKKTQYAFSMVGFILFQSLSYAGTSGVTHRPFYVGLLGGYGSTTWDGLVPSRANQNLAMSISTPIEVEEGGGVWGVFAGYELNPFFAVEMTYMNYTESTIAFDESSLFSFNNEGILDFRSKTETLSFMGKVMLYIPKTKVRVYSSAGIASLHRKDFLLDDTRLTPTFGVGFNFHMFNDRILSEVSGKYVAGFGESQLNPTDTFYPFLYSISYKMAYCF
jgi:hypothetical protein